MANTARPSAEVSVAMVPLEGQGEAEHLIPAHEPEGSSNLLLRRVSVNKLKVSCWLRGCSDKLALSARDKHRRLTQLPCVQVLSETGSKDLMTFYVRQNDILDCQVEVGLGFLFPQRMLTDTHFCGPADGQSALGGVHRGPDR